MQHINPAGHLDLIFIAIIHLSLYSKFKIEQFPFHSSPHTKPVADC
jgi:hypothetical protein